MAGNIVRDGATGQAIVSTTGTPVEEILEALASGQAHQDVLNAHPGLTGDDVAAALRFARIAVHDLLEKLVDGERELAEGLGIPHDELFSRFFQKFGAHAEGHGVVP